ncbi:MAG: CoA pyrophosphatase [Haloquadratum sp.]|jgi:8-oxo-dGTP pyrophosphatase MutT (NUDIX family)|nr:CoA pyrophosphatase [Haloquadratum sp.]
MHLDGLRGRRTPRRVAGRPAAVLVPVIDPDGAPRLLFTERSQELSAHAGQISFPGGRVEPTDADRRATALREATEEVGLDPTEAEVLGELDEITTVTGYAVRPVVAIVPARRYHPDESEIVAVHPVALETLLDTSLYERRIRPTAETERIVHYFHHDPVIWGATARICVQLFEETMQWQPPPVDAAVIDDPRDALP